MLNFSRRPYSGLGVQERPVAHVEVELAFRSVVVELPLDPRAPLEGDNPCRFHQFLY